MAERLSAKSAWKLNNALKKSAATKPTKVGTARVTRRDSDGSVWVRLPGSNVDTPVNGQILSDAQVGDSVSVRIENGRLSLMGNATTPAVGQQQVNTTVQPVSRQATYAMQEAELATTYATEAQASAALADALAREAGESAYTANLAAEGALLNLSTVEDVVDTLTWITKHGTMTLTTDTSVDPSKVYFVPDASGQYVVGGGAYSIVQSPTTEGLSGYYELTIDKSVENYIATHVSVTNEGLWLTPTSSNGYRVLIATGAGTTYTTAGTYIIDNSGNVRAIIGEVITLGGSGESHVVIDANGFNYFSSENYRVAHMGSDIRLSPRGYGNGLFMRPTSEGGIGLSLSNQQGGSPEFPSGKAGNYSIAAGKSVSAVRMAVEGGQIVGLVPVDVGTDSTGSGSIAVGRALQALSDYQAVFGRMNVPDENGDYALIVGNGHTMTHEEEEEKAQEVGDGSFINIAHSNALTVDWDGVVDCGGIAPKWATIDPSTFFSSMGSGWANDTSYTQLAYSPTLRRVVGRLRINSTAAHSAGNNVIGTVAAAYRPHIRALCCTTTTRTYKLYFDANGNATLALDAATTATQTEFYLVADYTMA